MKILNNARTRFLLATLGILLSGACASLPDRRRSPAGATPPPTNPFEHAVSALTKILEPRVLQLDRRVLTFHYERADYVLTTIDQITRRVSPNIDQFLNPAAVEDSLAGPGYYVALDPETSRRYGGDTPHLFVLPLRERARLLNLDVNARDLDAALGYRIVQTLGCPADARDNSFTTFFGQMRQSSNEVCRRAVIEAVRRTGAQAIVYHYPSSTPLKECRAYRPDAINVIRPEVVDWNQSAYFTDQTQVGGDEVLRSHLGRLFHELHADAFNGVAYRNVGHPAPRTLTRFRRDRTRAYRAWKTQNVAYCGPTWALESDSAPYARFLESFARLYVDPETRRLMAQIKKFMPDEMNPVDFSRINGVEAMMAAWSGIAPNTADYANWQMAKDTLRAPGGDVAATNDALAAAARLLTESPPRLKNPLEQMFFDLPVDQLMNLPTTPDLILEVARRLGFGPRTAALAAQVALLKNHAGPLVVAMPAPGDVADWPLSNQRAIRDFIKGCLISLPTKSATSYGSGPCEMRRSLISNF